MPYQISISPGILVKRLTIGVAVLTALNIPVQIAKYVFNYREDWMTMFNFDREMNLPTWYSAWMLTFCALLLRVIAIGKKTQGDRYYRHWNLLSIIFFFLAIDEVLQIHEAFIIPDLSRVLPWIFHSVWVIPYGIALVFFAKHYWKFTAHLPRQTRFHFLLAALLYIGGALGWELVQGYWTGLEGKMNLAYALMATVEEIMEMMGVIVLIYGLLYYIREWKTDLHFLVKII